MGDDMCIPYWSQWDRADLRSLVGADWADHIPFNDDDDIDLCQIECNKEKEKEEEIVLIPHDIDMLTWRDFV